MSVNFVDYFANEHNGYDILYQNMKYGLIASKELSEYFRERSNIEETNSKSLTKLAKQANSNCAQGTFAPFWGVLKCSAEKLSSLHQHMFQKVSELVKDVARYADELHKKHKAVKDSESNTLEVVLLIQNTKQALQKAKDVYTTKSAELDKLRKDNGSAKDIEKAEVKLKKLHEDYRQLAEKYTLVKQDFEKKMTQTCKHFQDVEEAHLKQMKQFVNSYADIIQNNHDLMGQVHRDFKHQCLELTVEKLQEQFLIEKYNSIEKAVDLPQSLPKPSSDNNSISEADQISNVSNGSQKPTQTAKAPKKEPSFPNRTTSWRTTSLLNLFTTNAQNKDEPIGSLEGSAPCSAPSSPSGTPATPVAPEKDENIGRTTLRESKWFLRSKRTKPKPKKSKKKKDEISENSTLGDRSDLEEKEEEGPTKEDLMNSPEVDDEGYNIRPKDEKGSVYSSTDSDSEEERDRKIHVEIKPITNGTPMSASVDELRATVENISLYKIGTARRGSNANTSKASSDMFDIFPPTLSPSMSNPTSPHGNISNPYAPLQPNRTNILVSPTPINNANVDDIFSEVGEMSQNAVRTSTPTTNRIDISVPRPPSRRSDGDFRAGGSSGSRGPSPLTIGNADTIPLAVAFHEIIHSYFRGTEETKCQVKMSGDMMLSFPTGIVGVLTNNPNPAKLCFRLKNIHRLDNVIPNKQLISINTLTSTRDSTVVDFNMPALSALLKKQSEKNPTAQYFNVDILKYQIRPKNGAASCPFQLVAYWKCERDHTDLKVDYKYNLHAMSPPSPLLNVSVIVPMNGDVGNVIAMPKTAWNPDNEQALWRFTELSQYSEDRGVGSLKARFELGKGPSNKGTISAQFNCEGATLSGIEFELIGGRYRLSLVKRRFVSGKYICDSEVP